MLINLLVDVAIGDFVHKSLMLFLIPMSIAVIVTFRRSFSLLLSAIFAESLVFGWGRESFRGL